MTVQRTKTDFFVYCSSDSFKAYGRLKKNWRDFSQDEKMAINCKFFRENTIFL